MATREEIIDRCQALYDDLSFTAAREWKDAKKGRHVIGFMPMYVPREIIHAAGMLPLGILGGGDQLEVIQGDAYYQSYICRIPRSTIELLLTDRLDFVDGMLFPSICDVIRNLSGMWKLLRPDVYSHYFDVPQNYMKEVGGEFYMHELNVLRHDLEKIGGVTITEDNLRNSIAVYNESRRLTRELYKFRSDKPWLAPSSEVYLINRAGMLIPVEDHNQLIKDYIEAASAEDRPKRDNSRVVISGSFCEQPPLNLIKSIEMSGCYVVDDDYMLVNRWFTKEVPTDGDPIQALSYTFLEASVKMPSCFEPNEDIKGLFLVDTVKENNAEGVIFAATSFCDPALLERPILQDVLNDADIPHISFKYAENTGQMQPIREQAGTFADSIKLWS
ncbi:MAG: benzoyl-CoA reductase subunit C [Alphaproteobacteria bacterium]|nr:MAG: benzoyl-CoA reductase subunit C [Alphaproteobacteria bacterium]